MEGTITSWNENKDNMNFNIELDGEISLRDYFAGQAIGLFSLTKSELSLFEKGEVPRHDMVADFCYSLADAMLERRKAGEQIENRSS